MFACVFGFLGRDTAAATGLGIRGDLAGRRGRSASDNPGSTSHALAVLLFAASAWILLCAVGSALGKLAAAVVLFLTALRFALTGLYELTASHGIEHAAAVVGLALVAAAAYVAFAMEVENLQRRTVLPLLRRGRGAEAMQTDLAAQARRLDREAGVREQL